MYAYVVLFFLLFFIHEFTYPRHLLYLYYPATSIYKTRYLNLSHHSLPRFIRVLYPLIWLGRVI